MSTAPTESDRSTLTGKLMALAGLVVSAAYLGNLGAGFFGEIPDNFPGIGNLDEVFFSGLLILSLAKLGINVIPNLQAPKAGPPKNLEPPR